MTWNSTMGLISTLALILPVILVLTLRLGKYKAFPVLIAYYFLLFIYNLMTEGYINANEDVAFYWGLANNLLDAPLMILFLSYFSTSQKFTKKLRVLIALFVGFEIARHDRFLKSCSVMNLECMSMRFP